ncbi:hypothetical protein BH11MYX3_BH11MYX3_03770 [soil metagenome]
MWLAACSGPTPATISDPTPATAATALGVTPMALDAHGIPRMLQASGAVAAPAATATGSALTHLQRLAPAWGVRDLPTLEGIGEVPVAGGTIVRIRQRIDGLVVEDSELRVYVGARGNLISISGQLLDSEIPRQPARFVDDDLTAVARAIENNYGVAFDRAVLTRQRGRTDGSRVVSGRSGTIDVQLASARQMWHRTGGHLVAAWVTETYASKTSSTNGDAFHTVTAADTGRVLGHHTLVADAAFSYRVYAEDTGELHPYDGPVVDGTPHATGIPNGLFPAYVAPKLVMVEGLNHPAGASTPDPWLAADATETKGNNVDAYTDVNAPNGFGGADFRASTTDSNTFDRTFDLAAAPLTTQYQQMAGITSLFYSLNWLHDFWYDVGFNEAAGNAQANNFGRGGQGGDAIPAEAQDNALGGSRNNANMSTPSDGMSPRMQVFVWTGKQELTVTASPNNRSPATGGGAFGLQSFDASGTLVLAEDGTAPGSDACTALTNDVAGKIVLLDRGTCGFKSKVLRAQEGGAAGVILANNMGTGPMTMGDDAAITTPITIGTISVSMAEGAALKADLAAGPVTVALHRLIGTDLDGTLDASVVAHEFGHYVHHRLSSCDTPVCGAMSEGWGDFISLMMIARSGDVLTGAYPMAIYSTQSFTNDAAYFGIRRAPYSSNPAINSLRFHHMSAGADLPTTHPFLASGNNSEVHNAGEVWASMLWDGYVALQLASPGQFDAVRTKMGQYVVAGLLMAPPQATPTETRDAILTAARAASVADHDVLAAAYATRGFGSCAVSADRDSDTFDGIVDGFELKGNAIAGAVSVAAVTDCDADGVVDGGETGRITLPIANRGPVELTDVTVTVTSQTAGVTVTSTPFHIPTLASYGSSNITAEFKLDGSPTAALAGNFSVEILAANSCVSTLTVPVVLRLNVDDVAASSATDTFDTGTSEWVAATDGADAWKRVRETGLDGVWHGDDLGSPANTTLTSPMLTADATAPVSVTFQHRYKFEGDTSVAYDSAVIEISTDGTTFVDVSTLGADPHYTGMVAAGPGANPLNGRNSYVGSNPAYPATEPVTLDFGTQLAGKTFQLRFRIGSDEAVSAEGWDVDDVAFSGIVGTPFPTQVVDTGSCDPAGDEDPDMKGDGDGGCCDAGPLGAANLGAALGVLGLVLRRRRRR